MKKTILFIMLLILVTASSASAIPIMGDTANSESNLGNFTGSFNYNSSGPTAAQLIVALTNTTPIGGGYLTAFAFNNPGNAISNVTLTGGFNILGDTTFNNSIPASPWGYFDIGGSATCTPSCTWNGGGSPTGGIGVGSTRIFTFALTGTSLDSLLTQDFINELSTGGVGKEFWFAARFRGIDAGAGSDKVPGTPGTPVPEPSTMLLLGIGIAGFVGFRRKLKS